LSTFSHPDHNRDPRSAPRGGATATERPQDDGSWSGTTADARQSTRPPELRLLFGFVVSVTSDADEKVPTGRRADFFDRRLLVDHRERLLRMHSALNNTLQRNLHDL
jgi:hypothetical protein